MIRRPVIFVSRPNFIILGLISLFVIIEILFLRPSSFERSEEENQTMFGSIETMVQAQKQRDEVGYTIADFHYTAVQGEVRNWEIFAREAILYEKTKLVLAQKSKIRMYDTTGKITFIEGDEAYYKMGTRDIDLEGNVKVIFPDGFVVETTRAHYSAAQDLISTNAPFSGETVSKNGERIQIWGTGFKSIKSGPDIEILKESRVKIKRAGEQETTEVFSDRSSLNRVSKVAKFSMSGTTKKVRSLQGTLDVQSRRQEATYDDQAKTVKYLTALDDVVIKETDEERSKEGLKYATCQKADFFTSEDKVVLTGFPSAYQGSDILTGEEITVYRSKNLIEVSQANAFHHGKSGSGKR